MKTIRIISKSIISGLIVVITSSTQSYANEIFTTNSDSSRTYLAGATICSADAPKGRTIAECSDGKSKIYFYAKGSDFIHIDENSLEIESLIVDDVDISKSRTLEDNFELGPFSEVNAERKLAIWSIVIASKYNSVNSRLRIKGRLKAITSSSLATIESSITDLSDFKTFKLGSISVIGSKAHVIKKDEIEDQEIVDLMEKNSLVEMTQQEARNLGRNLGESFVNRMESLFEGLQDGLISSHTKSYGKKIKVLIHGNIESVERLEVYNNGKKLRSRGISSIDSSAVYSFKNPSGTKNVTLKLFYWNTVKPVDLIMDF